MPRSKDSADRGALGAPASGHRLVRSLRRDEGSASLEFISAGVLLLVPMVYLVLTMSALQGAAFATEGAASQAARVYVQAPDEVAAAGAAARAVEYALDDYGLDAARATTTLTCRPDPADCLTRRGLVSVTVELPVLLPLVPAGLDLSVPLSVPVTASATQTVSRFWSDG